MNTLIKEYHRIINIPMKLEVKKELLTRIIIQLDSLNDIDKQQRKNFITKIQYILHILDNIIV